MDNHRTNPNGYADQTHPHERNVRCRCDGGRVIPVARVLGIALIALGVACWPGRTALCGMSTYSALVTAYLAFIVLQGEWAGPLLWLVVVLHLILTILLIGKSMNDDRTKPKQNS